MIRILSERDRARDLNSTGVVNISPLTDFSVENCCLSFALRCTCTCYVHVMVMLCVTCLYSSHLMLE